ncbi:MAG: VWA domain-containing protein, partial [Verrucomicrobia bacterium]|nr:VWA domain-containing protein [Verrucomicrobiota bacterium]
MTPIQQFMQKAGIPPAYEKDVNSYDFNTIEVVDDSASMESRFGNTTRWQFMKNFMEEEVRTTTLLDPDGCVEVYFLNRTPHGNNHSFKNTSQDIERLARSFIQDPSGSTPITKTLDTIIEDITPSLSEKKAHIRMHTDGIPDGNIEGLNNWLQSKFLNNALLVNNIAITFNLVTDDQSTIREYQKIDALTTKSGGPA